MDRRDFLSLAVSGLASAAAACGTGADGTAQVIDGLDGRVVHWEKDELVVLVSGAQPRYAPGETIRLTITVNNQGTKVVHARVRAKLIGRGQQPAVEAQVSSVSIGPDAAAKVEKELPVPTSLTPGDYTLQVEVPPWMLADARRPTGGGKMALATRIGM